MSSALARYRKPSCRRGGIFTNVYAVAVLGVLGSRRNRWSKADDMDQAILFVLFLAAMLAAWFGPRLLAGTLFAVALALTVADYFHHATGALKLSF